MLRPGDQGYGDGYGEQVEDFVYTVQCGVRLRPELLPIAVFAPDGSPLAATRVQITEAAHQANPLRTRFVVELLDDAGDVLESLPFETLAIALDQSMAMLGIGLDEWVVEGVSQ